MGWWPWDEAGPGKTPFSPGYVVGRGFGKGLNVALVGVRSGGMVAPLYDPKGKQKNGLWTVTGEDGIFCIQYQWDNAMDLRVFDNDAPTTASLLFYTDQQSYLRYSTPVVLVLNLPAVIKGQKMETKPQGGFGNYMIDKGVDWLMDTPAAKELLKAKLPVKSADSMMAVSVTDVNRDDMSTRRG